MIIAIEGIEASNLSNFTEKLQKWVDAGWDWDGAWRYEAGRFIAIVTRSRVQRSRSMEIL